MHKYSVRETDWSLEIADVTVTTAWKCPNCENEFRNLTGIQKLQHMNGRISFSKKRKNIIVQIKSKKLYFMKKNSFQDVS